MRVIRFTEEHEWIEVEDGVGRVGITDFAQRQLGDVVFVELPEIGAALKKGDEAAVVESVKAASEIYAPVSGEVVERNEPLIEEPSLVNSAPLDEGWFFRIRLSDPGELEELMDEEAYDEFIKALD
ncbi:MAG: glycine cleavage system protein GcvH [Rhodothalassiaceae bacterium]